MISNGETDLMKIKPQSVHERTPLYVGGEKEIKQAIMAADVMMGHDENCTTWIMANRSPESGSSGRRRERRRRGAA